MPAKPEAAEPIPRRPRRDGAAGSRVDDAYQHILALITGGTLAEGDRLPSEADLAARTGVSRPVVRQALSRLQHSGVVNVRWGAGTYIRDATGVGATGGGGTGGGGTGGGATGAGGTEPLFGPVRSLDEVRHAYTFRAALEGDAAALAAANRPDAPLETARRALDTLDGVLGTGKDAQDADLVFHFAVAAASGNPFFERVLSAIQRPLEFSIGLTRSLSLIHPHERRLVVQAEHRAVLDAIEAGRPDAARAAMRRHLENACRRLFEGPG